MPDLSDPIILSRLIVRTLAYAASLLAAGLWLFLAAHRIDSAAGRAARRLAAAAAAAGIALAGATVLAEALFLTAGDWAAALDPFLLSVVVDGPIGAALATRIAGLGLVLLGAVGPAFRPLGVIGALAVAASFSLVGHSVTTPRAALAALVALHVGAAAYWIGAFAPLARLARVAPPAEAGRVAEAFGRGAVWAVGLLIVAGVALGLTFGGDPLAALSSAWGRMLAVKLILVAGLLLIAALNKLRLSPRLAVGDVSAAVALRRSIAFEAGLAAAIVAATTLMTSTGAPAA